MQRKCDILSASASQEPGELPEFTRDTFEAIARLRGVECNAPQGYAEAFYGRKSIIAA